MVKGKFRIVTGLLLALGLAYWFFIYNSEERRIKRQFTHLSEWFFKEPGDSGLALATRVGRLKSLLAEECELNLEMYDATGTYAKDTIANHALAVLTEAHQLQLDLYDLSIEISSPTEAHASLTARLLWQTATGERLAETHELATLLEKIDDTWRFVRVDIIDVLEK